MVSFCSAVLHRWVVLSSSSLFALTPSTDPDCTLYTVNKAGMGGIVLSYVLIPHALIDDSWFLLLLLGYCGAGQGDCCELLGSAPEGAATITKAMKQHLSICISSGFSQFSHCLQQDYESGGILYVVT